MSNLEEHETEQQALLDAQDAPATPDPAAVLEAIQALMSDAEWSVEWAAVILEDIADVMDAAGYEITNVRGY